MSLRLGEMTFEDREHRRYQYPTRKYVGIGNFTLNIEIKSRFLSRQK
jgi:hypothetical protein